MLIKILLSLFPVFIFLLSLILLDSYKLIKPAAIILTIISGCAAAVFCYFCNTWLVELSSVYRNYGIPILEETAKAAFFIFLLKRKKVGFMVDAAIYGFALGSGFAFIENLYYLQILDSSNLLLWAIRGFGTAIMHGSTTAIFAIISKAIFDRKNNDSIFYIIPGLLLAILIHSIYNQFLFSPIIITMLQLLVLPLIVAVIYYRSERSLQEWMELSFETDVKLIKLINSENISQTKIGRYLYSLKSKFQPSVVADMLCFIKIYNELSIRAKGVLMMREAGFNSEIPPDVTEQFKELKYLEKNIGPTGKLALSPILKNNTKDLWQLYFLESK